MAVLNILNLVAYIANFAVVYFITSFPGAKSNPELSELYQTIITPAGYAFAIWGIIFVSQAIWAVAQLFFQQYKNHPLVVDGVRYNYVFVCLAQMVWSLVFAYEHIPASLIAMLTIWYFLIQTVRGLRAATEEESSNTSQSFWLLQFPFLIHCGWITAASFVNISVVFVYFHAGATLQSIVGFTSLVALVAAALLISKDDSVIPCVLAWATFGIFNELASPKSLIESTFSPTVIATTRWMALAGCILILVTVVIRVAMKARRRRSGTNNEGEESTYLRHEEGSIGGNP